MSGATPAPATATLAPPVVKVTPYAPPAPAPKLTPIKDKDAINAALVDNAKEQTRAVTSDADQKAAMAEQHRRHLENQNREDERKQKLQQEADKERDDRIQEQKDGEAAAKEAADWSCLELEPLIKAIEAAEAAAVWHLNPNNDHSIPNTPDNEFCLASSTTAPLFQHKMARGVRQSVRLVVEATRGDLSKLRAQLYDETFKLQAEPVIVASSVQTAMFSQPSYGLGGPFTGQIVPFAFRNTAADKK